MLLYGRDLLIHLYYQLLNLQCEMPSLTRAQLPMIFWTCTANKKGNCIEAICHCRLLRNLILKLSSLTTALVFPEDFHPSPNQA